MRGTFTSHHNGNNFADDLRRKIMWYLVWKHREENITLFPSREVDENVKRRFNVQRVPLITIFLVMKNVLESVGTLFHVIVSVSCAKSSLLAVEV